MIVIEKEVTRHLFYLPPFDTYFKIYLGHVPLSGICRLLSVVTRELYISHGAYDIIIVNYIIICLYTSFREKDIPIYLRDNW